MPANATATLPTWPFELPGFLPNAAVAYAAHGSGTQGIHSGFSALDSALPNGQWPASSLIELLTQADNAEWTLLGPMLASLTQRARQVILLAPVLPCVSMLRDFGIDLRYLRLLQTERPADRIWAIQHALDSPDFGALLCWLPQAHDHHVRRLQTAAAASAGLVFAIRPATCRYQSSPAPLRLLCSVTPDDRYAVQVIKRRGPVRHEPVLLPLHVQPKSAVPATPVPAVSKVSPLRKWTVQPLKAGTGTRMGSRVIRAR